MLLAFAFLGVANWFPGETVREVKLMPICENWVRLSTRNESKPLTIASRKTQSDYWKGLSQIFVSRLLG
jgi:hypothetical protein